MNAKGHMKITPEARVQALATIVAGLAASGHYTRSHREEDGDLGPSLIRFDNGKDWEKHGYSSRWWYPILGDAETLFDTVERWTDELEAFRAEEEADPPEPPPVV